MSKYILPHLYLFFGFVICILALGLLGGKLHFFFGYMSFLLMAIGVIWIVRNLIVDIKNR